MKKCVDCLHEHDGLEKLCGPCLDAWEAESNKKEVPCKSCNGTGINYMVGLDPDWCGNCWGIGIDWV